jgi:hypothetical protein
MKDYIVNQLTQPSTWRGIILIATSAGCVISPEVADAIVAFGIGLAGAVGVFTSDK